MSYHVTITCPACGQPLDAEVDMIEETEGDSTIPYGTRTYMALDDYTIDWNAHHASLTDVEDSDGVLLIEALSGISCQEIISNDDKLDDMLVERLGNAGMQAEIAREPDVD